jgi:hypothetical protein
MMDRRIFMQGAALVATVPAIANLLSLASATPSNTPLNPAPLPGQSAPPQAAAACAPLKIHGWDCESDNDSQAVIRITQSWRTAWR